MKTYVSIWSADLLNISETLAVVDDHTEGYHIDIMDGSFVKGLLFGPDLVKALRARTKKIIDVHLMVEDADYWLNEFIESGADVITFHTRSTDDGQRTVKLITSAGLSASHAIEVDENVSEIPLWDSVDRYLVMGTAIGIKGVDIDPMLYTRVEHLGKRLQHELHPNRLTTQSTTEQSIPEIWVDGGIRPHTVEKMAACGVHGVIPGSIVLGDSNPCQALDRIHRLGAAT